MTNTQAIAVPSQKVSKPVVGLPKRTRKSGCQCNRAKRSQVTH